MKKNNKKGFTIVELVIVIAVIAILAAVLIPTFSSIIKKAKVNNDIQLVRNLNTALATDTKEHKTMQDALDAAFEFGYDVAKINNTSVEENEILWDSVNDVFCYLKDGALEYVPNSATTVLEATDYRLWKISDTVDATYSTYYVGSETTIEAKKGFDAGTTTGITAINYTNNGSAQDVVIRTNSESTTLTITAPLDTINHYDAVGIVNVVKTANASYHEFGIANYIENASGRVVAEQGGTIETVIIKDDGDSATIPAVIENNGGTINNAYATTNAVATENNTDSKNIQLVVSPVENGGNVLAEGKSADETAAIIEVAKDEAAPEAYSEEVKNSAPEGVSYVARIGRQGYERLDAALAANTVNTTVYLLADYELPADYNPTELFEGTFDGQNHRIYTSKAIETNSFFDGLTKEVILKNFTIVESNGHLVSLSCAKFNYTDVTFDNVDYESTDSYYYQIGHNDSLYTYYCYDFEKGSWTGNVTIKNCDVKMNLKGSDSSNSAVFFGAYQYYGNGATLTVDNCSYTGTFIGNYVSLVLSNGQNDNAESVFATNPLKITNLKNYGTLIGSNGAYAVGGQNHSNPSWSGLVDYYNQVQSTTGGVYTIMDNSKLAVEFNDDGTVKIVDNGVGATSYKVLLYASRKVYNANGVEYASNYNYGITFDVATSGNTDIQKLKIVDYDTAIAENLITESDCTNNWKPVNSDSDDMYQIVTKGGVSYYVVKFAASDNGDTFKIELQDVTVQVSAYDANGLLKAVAVKK